ncbi:MAG: GTPase, partial [Actinomycetota bacterium]
TIEEREEYEPHLAEGRVVFAGVDYRGILTEAEAEADVVLWDGGNNDFPFYRPDLHVTVTDPLRAGDELRYHPGETNLRLAHVVVINKVDSATPEEVAAVRASVARANPGSTIVLAESVVEVEDPAAVAGKRVLVVEDGPTLTHGEMLYGAGVVAAKRYGAAQIVDPRTWAAPSIREVYVKYRVGPLLPAMGYSPGQVADLEETINAADVDLVLVATPVDLRKIVRIDKPALRVSYELREVGTPTLEDVLAPLISRVTTGG